MQIPAVLMLCITLATGLIGLVFLLIPDRIAQLEAWLNARWGNREVASLRFGLSGEQTLEEIINRDVLAHKITWDGWTKRHPRLVGIALCLVAVSLWWQM